MNINEWEMSDELENKHLPLTEKPNEVMSMSWKMDNDVRKVELQGDKHSEKLQFTGKLMKIEP